MPHPDGSIIAVRVGYRARRDLFRPTLIVEAAIRSGATILYTEDMHPGTRYGTLELRNPFLG